MFLSITSTRSVTASWFCTGACNGAIELNLSTVYGNQLVAVIKIPFPQLKWEQVMQAKQKWKADVTGEEEGKKVFLAKVEKVSHKVFRNKGDFCVFVQQCKVIFKKIVLIKHRLVRI